MLGYPSTLKLLIYVIEYYRSRGRRYGKSQEVDIQMSLHKLEGKTSIQIHSE